MSDTDSDTPMEPPISSMHDIENIVVGPTGKRLDYITWNQHHMFMARTIGEMSSTGDEGCYVVDDEHYQIGSGYSGELPATEHCCSHAISVALQRMKKQSKPGEVCTMYLTKPPNCHRCVDRILEMKISRIFYWEEESKSLNRRQKKTADEIRRRLFQTICEKYHPTRQISIEFQ